MKRKSLLAVAALAVLLTGCSSYERTREPEKNIPVPEGCVVLYKHTTGDDESQDKYDGVYCKADVKVEVGK